MLNLLKKPPLATIRIAAPGDMRQIALLDEMMFQEFCWDEDQVVRFLQSGGCKCYVALIGRRVIGYLFYEEKGNFYRVHRFAVHSTYHRRGVGTQLFTELVARGLTGRLCTVMVNERSIDALLFLKANNWIARGLVPDFFDGSDGVRMRRRV